MHTTHHASSADSVLTCPVLCLPTWLDNVKNTAYMYGIGQPAHHASGTKDTMQQAKLVQQLAFQSPAELGFDLFLANADLPPIQRTPSTFFGVCTTCSQEAHQTAHITLLGLTFPFVHSCNTTPDQSHKKTYPNTPAIPQVALQSPITVRYTKAHEETHPRTHLSRHMTHV
eukprot:1158860-Pelagomonas_calceolata.AAC.4